MLRKTVRRCGTLTLVLALALAGVAPVAADEIGGPRGGMMGSVWSWLADLFGFSPADTEGDTGGLHAIWQEEGAGFEPNGQPKPTGSGTDEGPGFEPNGG